MIHHVVDVTYLDKNGLRQIYRYVGKDNQKDTIFDNAQEDAIAFAQSCIRTGLKIFNPISKTIDYYPVHRVLHTCYMSFED
jgi:hypothetical protein